MNILHDLKSITDDYSEALREMPPGDQRAMVGAMIERTKELVCQADAMSADGHDIEHIIDRIYNQFKVIDKLIT
jgi:hypothetical protein